MSHAKLPLPVIADILRRTRNETRGDGAAIHQILKDAVFGKREPKDPILANYPHWMMVVRRTGNAELDEALVHNLQNLAMDRNFAESPEEIEKTIQETKEKFEQ